MGVRSLLDGKRYLFWMRVAGRGMAIVLLPGIHWQIYEECFQSRSDKEYLPGPLFFAMTHSDSL